MICRRRCSSARPTKLDTVPPPLLDRMELIFLQGYSEEEKKHIAIRYLIPRQIKENGITPEQIEFPEDSLLHTIRHYTREAGVRKLEQTHRHHLPQRGAARGRGQHGKTYRHARNRQGVSGRHPGARRHRDHRARQASRRGRGTGLDAGRRRHSLHRGQQDEGQGQLRHDRADRPGDAGVDAGRADLGALERCFRWAWPRTSPRKSTCTFTCRRERFPRTAPRPA